MLKALPSSDWLSIRSLSFKRAVYRVASLLRKEVANRILIGGSESPLLFTILLLGTLYAEKTPILMGADTSTRLPMKEAFDLLLLGETESSSGLEALPHLQVKSDSNEVSAEEIDAFFCSHSLEGTASLLLYTSGSSGKPKEIVKTLSQMDAEVASLTEYFSRAQAENRYGAINGATVLSTVDPHHQYGLTFAVWFPMALGLELSKERIHYEEMLTLETSWVLVTTPTFLRTLTTPLTHSPLWAMSTGGKLEESDLAAWRHVSPAPLEEIYGSTECGVIAHRVHREEGLTDNWALSSDATLTIEEGAPYFFSPHSSSSVQDSLGRVALDDKLTLLTSKTFKLLGRADRVAKIGEKRLSLTEIENTLLTELGLVAQALVVKRGAREAIGVIVDREHSTTYDSSAHVEYRKKLINHLEPLALPRYWRSVEKMPHNAQGKLEISVLEKLFYA